jgi:ribosomal protein S18 acetylase RimI-like enzyme
MTTTDTPSTLSSIQTLEEVSFRAWAALETERYDGWVLRFANGYTGRANSVNPLYASTLNVREKIAYCADWYQRRGVRLRFRLNPAMQPPELESVLDSAGFSRREESWVMTASLATAALGTHPTNLDITLESAPSERWMHNFCRLHPSHAPHLITMQAIMGRITGTQYYATLWAAGEAVAMGLGVREGEYAGLFDIITREDQRGKGYGRALVGELLRAAAQDGATLGYLQVAAQNTPAMALYRGFGFQIAYPYWYRYAPE